MNITIHLQEVGMFSGFGFTVHPWGKAGLGLVPGRSPLVPSSLSRDSVELLSTDSREAGLGDFVGLDLEWDSLEFSAETEVSFSGLESFLIIRAPLVSVTAKINIEKMTEVAIRKTNDLEGNISPILIPLWE